MVNKPSVKVDYAILCDDIRQEKNGKLILIGIYSGDILLRDFPSNLLLSMLLHGKASADCSITIEIRYRVEFENAEPYEVFAKGEMQIKGTEEPNEFYVPLPRVPIEFSGAGNLSVACRIDSKRWKTLLNKNIKPLDS